jgi:hypothetical protein
MKSAKLCAMLMAISACTAEGGDDNYLTPNNPAGSGASGHHAAAGTPGSGQGGAAGGTMAPRAGSGAQPPSAGMSPVSAGTGGQQGGAGMMTAGAGGQSTAGAAGGGGQPAAGGTTGGNTPGSVTIAFTTVSYGGEYAPLNYGAVWFEDASGEFIKTAKRWAGTVHASDLVAWTEASGGWGSIFGGGNMADMMDAVSSATIRTHQMHTVTWNMMDADKQLVPDGPYVAVIEMSESRARDRAGPLVRIEFTKGPSPQTVEPAAMESFTGIKLTYEP